MSKDIKTERAEKSERQPQKKAPRAGRRDAVESFDPFWNNKAGTVDSAAQYVQNACRERPGFRKGARIR